MGYITEALTVKYQIGVFGSLYDLLDVLCSALTFDIDMLPYGLQDAAGVVIMCLAFYMGQRRTKKKYEK